MTGCRNRPGTQNLRNQCGWVPEQRHGPTVKPRHLSKLAHGIRHQAHTRVRFRRVPRLGSIRNGSKRIPHAPQVLTCSAVALACCYRLLGTAPCGIVTVSCNRFQRIILAHILARDNLNKLIELVIPKRTFTQQNTLRVLPFILLGSRLGGAAVQTFTNHEPGIESPFKFPFTLASARQLPSGIIGIHNQGVFGIEPDNPAFTVTDNFSPFLMRGMFRVFPAVMRRGAGVRRHQTRIAVKLPGGKGITQLSTH